ncbi:MAG: AI-2E family transporter [Caldimicrobium sp.]|nr:AI-2E family transporter [Caldimicrobium sp.]MDW8183573.1 AI-2E family transporter [Caldimicrobium sp.]
MKRQGTEINFSIIIALSLIIIGLFAYLIVPFFMIIFWGSLLAFFLYPIYSKILNQFKNKKTISALTTLFIFIFFILTPLFFLGFQLFLQIESNLQYLNELSIFKIIEYLQSLKEKPLLSKVYPHLEPYLESFQSQLPQHIPKITEKLLLSLSGMLTWSFGLVFKLFLTLFTLYYFLVDGERIIQIIKELIPGSEDRKDIILKRIALIIEGVLFGNLLTALIQGALSLFIYLILGLSSYAILAFLTILASFLPFFGTALIWIPASLYLIITGSYIKGIILIIYSALIVSQVDNLIKPLLIGGKTKIHNLLMFFAVLGGLARFGLTGIFLGPIILGLFLSIIEIYKAHLLNNHTTSSENH